MKTTRALILSLMVTLYISSPVDAVNVGAIVKGIEFAYKVYSGLKSFTDPTTKELLQDAVTEAVAEIKLLHDEDLISEVEGLQSTFNRILYLNSDDDNRILTMELFLRDSDAVEAKLESVINSGEPNRAHLVASSFNLLVSLRAAVMTERGHDRAFIEKEVFTPAIFLNEKLLGDLKCTSEYQEIGHAEAVSGDTVPPKQIGREAQDPILYFPGSGQNGSLKTRAISYFPITGLIYESTLKVSENRMPYNDEIYRLVKDSNDRILRDMPHMCRRMVGDDIYFRWISNGTPYRHNTCDWGGNSCIIFSRGYGESPMAGFHCTRVHESKEPGSTTWTDNYLCSDVDLGMQWSSAGPLDNMDCVQWHELREPEETTWHDNYLCFPKSIGQKYVFKWSSRGPIANMKCTHITETREPSKTTWGDNYFCYSTSGVKLPHTYMTDRFSEEGIAGQLCDYRYAVKGIHCSGRYCDNKRLLCYPYVSAFDLEAEYNWAPSISEERPNSYYSQNEFLSGLRCRGRYCDNVSMEFMSTPALQNTNQCYDKAYISEEQGGTMCNNENEFVAGLKCQGRYCDNLSLRCCTAKVKAGVTQFNSTMTQTDMSVPRAIPSEKPLIANNETSEIYLPLISQ